MRLAAWAVAAALLLLGGAVTFAILRGENTRSIVKRTVDPCKRPESKPCQRRIRLVLRELVKRHPGELRKLGLRPRRDPTVPPNSSFDVVPRGGGPDNPPSGGGPTGRVPGPRPGRPAPPPTPTPRPPRPEPLLDVEPPSVCVGDLVRVNC